MYMPAPFNEERPDVLYDFIEKNPLGILVANVERGLDANHIPFELDRKQGMFGMLHSHVARKNPVWQELKPEQEVLVIFRSADAYISPGWYPSKRETGRQVPTWNYIVVHAHGRAMVRDSESYVRGMVARLTRTHEAAQSKPWRMTDGPKDFIDMMLKNIVGIEIEITRLSGKWKLSQNKESRDIHGAVEGLKEQGETVISDEMLAGIRTQ